MDRVEGIAFMFSYHFDTTMRLLSAAEESWIVLGAQEPAVGGRSIPDLLFHILDTDRGWRIGIETGRRPERWTRDDFPGLPDLRRALQSERGAWGQLLADLTEDEIGEGVEIASRPGRVLSVGRWKVMHHVLLHGMQHHSEIAAQLTAAGRSPGDIDFIFYS